MLVHTATTAQIAICIFCSSTLSPLSPMINISYPPNTACT
jgi:hypothetical protein